MWQDISKVILITDMDGTILSDELRISDREIESVKEFRRQGGNFTVSTGRSFPMMERYSKWLSLDDCAVLSNGSMIYDYKNKKIIWKQVMDNDSFDFIRECAEKFPYVAVELLTDKTIYAIRMNKVSERHLLRENVSFKMTDFDYLKSKGLLKCLFALTEEHMAEFSDFVVKNKPDSVDCVQSSSHYYELLPKGISKATANRKMLEITDRGDFTTVAIGDFYNDLEMIKTADFGVTVATAPDDIKSQADLVVSSCKDGAVTDLIKYIIEKTKV